MTVLLQLNNVGPKTLPSAHCLTWRPSLLRLQWGGPKFGPGPVPIVLSSDRSSGGGDLLFSAATSAPPRRPARTLTVPLPGNGTSVTVLVRGRFGKPSSAFGDVRIVAKRGATVMARMPVMVRVRKNAVTLSTGERDRFIAAMAQLNNMGTGRFADFRNMHVNVATPEAHFAAGFLPWHRSYLLDLERELQQIDPTVALPYWRFDQPAGPLFSQDFLGETTASGFAVFAPSNPLSFWTTDGVLGVDRQHLPSFDPSTMAVPTTRSDAQTLALGTSYGAFRTMEGDPHGRAHTRGFSGWVSQIPTAAKDPLFFLLHCNVDRLWAKWQRANARFDPTQAASYDSGSPPGGLRIGHNLGDTMWPWNLDVNPPRPATAPGGAMSSSPIASAPGNTPTVSSMLDYHGAVSPSNHLGFCYDDVAF